MVLGNDEIEVACDALWCVRRLQDGFDHGQQSLWDRLQRLRSGDYGGDSQVELGACEGEEIARALERAAALTPLDEDELRLFARLRSSGRAG